MNWKHDAEISNYNTNFQFLLILFIKIEYFFFTTKFSKKSANFAMKFDG